jgi:HK97 gp10 family phage protein
LPEEAVEGLKEASNLLRQFGPMLEKKILGGAMKAAASSMVPALRAAAPVFTGRLEESIVAARETAGQSQSRVNGTQVAAVVKILGVARKYWHFSEFGTVHMPARPWARPTFAAQQGAAAEAVKKYIVARAAREARALAKGGSGG